MGVALILWERDQPSLGRTMAALVDTVPGLGFEGLIEGLMRNFNMDTEIAVRTAGAVMQQHLARQGQHN